MLNQKKADQSSSIFRYERKYLINGQVAQQIENLIKLHPAYFSQLYYPRQVNNLYFDTYDWEFYFSNINGLSKRQKIRLRWYGNQDQIENSQIENKIKQEDLTSKYVYSLTDLHFIDLKKQNLNQMLKLLHKKVDELYKNKLINQQIKICRPVLVNSYFRQYFLSNNKKFRLTLDSDINFYHIKKDAIDYSLSKKLAITILEIKYQQADDQMINQISRYFPFQLSKSSKYQLGVDTLYSRYLTL